MANYVTFTIAASGDTSGAILVGKERALTSVKMPGAFTGTKITVHGSIDGSNYSAIYMDGSVQELSFSASRLYQINPRVTYGLHSVKFVSDGTEASERSFPATVERVI